MNVSKGIHLTHTNASVWQRGFHDYIIRDHEDYETIFKYIHENPMRWQFDKLYSEE